jgi:hypothetical protein
VRHHARGGIRPDGQAILFEGTRVVVSRIESAVCYKVWIWGFFVILLVISSLSEKFFWIVFVSKLTSRTARPFTRTDFTRTIACLCSASSTFCRPTMWPRKWSDSQSCCGKYWWMCSSFFFSFLELAIWVCYLPIFLFFFLYKSITDY